MADAFGLELLRMTCVATMASGGEVTKHSVKKPTTVAKPSLQASAKKA
jgi:hypothetical protein